MVNRALPRTAGYVGAKSYTAEGISERTHGGLVGKLKRRVAVLLTRKDSKWVMNLAKAVRRILIRIIQARGVQVRTIPGKEIRAEIIPVRTIPAKEIRDETIPVRQDQIREIPADAKCSARQFRIGAAFSCRPMTL